MNEQNQVAVLPKQENAVELTRRSSDVAGLCKEIVLKTACQIQGRKYVKVEGWQSIATAHGCVAGCRDVERVQGGVRAIGELRRMSDNAVLATAEGFVGEDEPTWFGGQTAQGKTLPKRPDYAIRAMCQTRAISRVCRSAFAHVVVLMDCGLSTTPAEEVPDGGFIDVEAQPARPTPPPATSSRPASQAAPQSQPEAKEGDWRKFIVPKFIKKYAGMTLGDMELKDLAWWAENYEPKPFRGSISPQDEAFRAALDDAVNSGELDQE